MAERVEPFSVRDNIQGAEDLQEHLNDIINDGKVPQHVFMHEGRFTVVAIKQPPRQVVAAAPPIIGR